MFIFKVGRVYDFIYNIKYVLFLLSVIIWYILSCYVWCFVIFFIKL